MEAHNPYQLALKQLNRVARKIKLDPNIHEKLKYPKTVLIVSIPVIMDNGKLQVFTGYGCSTISTGVLPKAGSVSIRMLPWITSRPWPCR